MEQFDSSSGENLITRKRLEVIQILKLKDKNFKTTTIIRLKNFLKTKKKSLGSEMEIFRRELKMLREIIE